MDFLVADCLDNVKDQGLPSVMRSLERAAGVTSSPESLTSDFRDSTVEDGRSAQNDGIRTQDPRNLKWMARQETKAADVMDCRVRCIRPALLSVTQPSFAPFLGPSLQTGLEYC